MFIIPQGEHSQPIEKNFPLWRHVPQQEGDVEETCSHMSALKQSLLQFLTVRLTNKIIFQSYHDFQQQFALGSMKNFNKISNSFFPNVQCMSARWSCHNTTQLVWQTSKNTTNVTLHLVLDILLQEWKNSGLFKLQLLPQVSNSISRITFKYT